MGLDFTDEPELVELGIDLHGGFSKGELHQLIDQLGDGDDILAVRIEIETDQPAALTLPGSEDRAARTDGESSEQIPTSPVGDGESAAVPESPRDSAPNDEPESVSDQVPRLQIDSDPFYVMCLLDELESWTRTKEIREELPDEWDVSRNTLGTTLWNLADRDLLDKQPYQDDERQTEYRLTATGQQAVEQALDRADSHPSVPQQ